MKRSAYIGSAGVSGGGGDALGALEYFAAGSAIPVTHLPADGRTIQKKEYPAYFAKKAAVFAGKRNNGRSTQFWTGSGPDGAGDTQGRKAVVYGGIMAMYSNRVESSGAIGYTYYTAGVERVGVGNSGLANRDLGAVSYVNGFAMFFTTVRSTGIGSVSIGTNPDFMGAGAGFSDAAIYETRDAPGGANVVNNLKPVFFKGLYVSGNLTTLRTCVGPTDWETWTARVTTGRVGNFIDIMTNGEVIAAFTSTGEVFTSSDAITWTEQTPVGLPAGTYTQAAYDGGVTFAFISTTASAGGTVYTSVDLINWTARTGVFGDVTSGAVYTVQGGASMLFAMRTAAGTSTCVVASSVDGGVTWSAYLTTADVPVKPRMVLVADGGFVAVFGGNVVDGANAGFDFFSTGSVLPRAQSILEGGTTYKPYVRVR